MPSLVRVVTVHALEGCKRIGAQVLLVNDPVVADHERLHPRDFVLGWRGRQSKSSDHYAFNHEVHLTYRGGGTLPFQNLEKVSVKWLGFGPVALRQSVGDRLSNRTAPAPVRVLPSKPILFPRRTDDALSILVQFGAIVLIQGVFLLRLYKAPANLNGIQFIFANASKQDLLASGFGVVVPLAIPLNDRNWKRPIVIADRQRGAIRIFGVDPDRLFLVS